MQKLIIITAALLLLTITIAISIISQSFSQPSSAIPMSTIPDNQPSPPPQQDNLFSTLTAATQPSSHSHPAKISPPPNAELLHTQISPSPDTFNHIATYKIENSTIPYVINHYKLAAQSNGFTPVIPGLSSPDSTNIHNKPTTAQDYANQLFIRSLPADINENGHSETRQTLVVRATSTYDHAIRIFVAFSYPKPITPGKIMNP